MTIGKKFAQLNQDRSLPRLLDHRTRSVLRTICTGPKHRLGANVTRVTVGSRQLLNA